MGAAGRIPPPTGWRAPVTAGPPVSHSSPVWGFRDMFCTSCLPTNQPEHCHPLHFTDRKTEKQNKWVTQARRGPFSPAPHRFSAPRGIRALPSKAEDVIHQTTPPARVAAPLIGHEMTALLPVCNWLIPVQEGDGRVGWTRAQLGGRQRHALHEDPASQASAEASLMPLPRSSQPHGSP